MKRQALIDQLRAIATAKGLTFSFVRNGANHEIHQLGPLRVTIPRHREINEQTAKAILREAGKL